MSAFTVCLLDTGNRQQTVSYRELPAVANTCTTWAASKEGDGKARRGKASRRHCPFPAATINGSVCRSVLAHCCSLKSAEEVSTGELVRHLIAPFE